MRNLEQIRAQHALAFIIGNDAITGAEGGNILSRLPTMIASDGLLATAAFAKAKGGGFEKTMDDIFAHLKSQAIANDLADLASKGSLELQRASTEALAYANYIKRFGKAKRKED
ncbi:MAG: hypothetical protein FJ222_09060 [Lentisphaerae bacterium]|nr:hypothetical protein [Lentisphaerota bacterium]